MSLRTRLTLVAAAAVAVAIALASGVAYVSTRDRLREQVDESLRRQAVRVLDARLPVDRFRRPIPEGPVRGDEQYFQVVAADGSHERPPNQNVDLPVSAQDRALALGGDAVTMRDVRVGGAHLRMATIPVGGGVAVQLARPLAGIDDTLASLRLTLTLVALGGVALAALLGLLVARTTLRPVERLTAAAEHVAETEDLGASIDVERNDELGRLATSFNTMLAALADSRQQQRQLVADASHELRTPLTSLRTNIEVLAGQADMPAGERAEVLRDLTTQLEELSVLVGDLLQLARDDAPDTDEPPTDIRLDELVERAVARARLHARDVDVRIVGDDPAVVHGRRAPIERALSNLLDNACKWSPPDGVIDVRQLGGTVTVRDRGPGIAPDDLPKVFNRFYRAPAARAMPGSGLGLAIVRQVADQHGGAATAQPADGGGTVVTLRLPTAPTTDS